MANKETSRSLSDGERSLEPIIAQPELDDRQMPDAVHRRTTGLETWASGLIAGGSGSINGPQLEHLML